jgi:adenosylmethionine-8-amino-7-oxononanoate aminotransferase
MSAQTTNTRRPALIHNVLSAHPPLIERGEGVWVYDTTGKRYFDACSGAVVSGIGHAHPHVLEVMAQQASRVTFAHRGAFSSRAAEELANRLADASGYAGAWLVNSGSEAVEAAMQFALQYQREIGQDDRRWFLSHRRSYHGNTLGGLSLSGHARRDVVRGLAYEFAVLEEPYAFANAGVMSEAEYTNRLLAAAREQFEQVAHKVAGVVAEPIGGATLGANVPPDGYLQGLSALCEEFGALLIADEVMTGVGRTGKFLAVEHWGVRPHLVAMGKGLSAGYTPIAATLVDESVLNTIEAGSGRVRGGHTFGGNPLSSATALAVMDVMESEKLVDRAAELGDALAALLRNLAQRHPVIVDTRGLGLLRGVELDTGASGRDAGPGALAAMFGQIAQDEGAIVYPVTGGFNDAVLIAPPLTTASEELDELFVILDRAFARLAFELEEGA